MRAGIFENPYRIALMPNNQIQPLLISVILNVYFNVYFYASGLTRLNIIQRDEVDGGVSYERCVFWWH